MVLLEAGVDFALDLVALQEVTRKILHLLHFQRALVVSVDGVVDVIGHLGKLARIDKDIGQVLDGLLEVKFDSNLLLHGL